MSPGLSVSSCWGLNDGLKRIKTLGSGKKDVYIDFFVGEGVQI